MRSLNLQTKIILYAVGVVATMIVLITGMNLLLDYRYSRQHSETHLADLASSMTRTVRDDLYFNRTYDLRKTIRNFSQHQNIEEIVILDPQKNRISGNERTSSTARTGYYDAPEKAVERKGTTLWRHKERIFALSPIPGESGTSLGYVFMSASTLDENHAFRVKLGRALILGGLLGIFGSIAGFLAGRRLTRSLKALTDGAREMAEGREPEKIEATSKDELGQLTMTFNNMVERRQMAEASLERSRQHLLFILRETPLAYIEWNLDFQVVNWNKAAERIFGYTSEEASGRHPMDLIVPREIQSRIEDLWTNILAGTGGTSSLNENIHADGSRIMCQWNNTVIRNSEGKITAVASLVDDVTESIKTQEKMRAAMETAQQATQAKSNFLANMSHEIRTPMNGVIGLTDLLLESELLPEQRSYVDIIRTSGEMLLTIINDILDLSKIESGKLDLSERIFDLEECLSSAFHLFSRNLDSKNLEHSVELDTSIPRFVVGDPIRLRQIVYNLIGNAVKFTDQGAIRLKAHAEKPNPDKIRIHVSVTDSGCGIDQERLQTIFDPFNQGDTSPTRTHGGTGLGLTICKRLCQMMQGDIRIESTSSAGTIFAFDVELRCASEEEEALRAKESPVKSKISPANSLNILVAEDNAVNRLVTKRILKRLGFDCTTADDGSKAVKHALSNPCDLIFMDIQMPVMDGLNAARAIKEKLGDSVYIVALTASTIEGDRQRCFDAGMDDYLAKPIDIHAISKVVRKIDRVKRAQT